VVRFLKIGDRYVNLSHVTSVYESHGGLTLEFGKGHLVDVPAEYRDAVRSLLDRLSDETSASS
jgi:hypothetical protein